MEIDKANKWRMKTFFVADLMRETGTEIRCVTLQNHEKLAYRVEIRGEEIYACMRKEIFGVQSHKRVRPYIHTKLKRTCTPT